MTTEKLTFQAIMSWDEDQCREFLASMRWPDGVRCPKCGSTEEPYIITRKSAGKNKQPSLYRCRACRKQFTVTVGTIFEDSKIPLSKWLAALFLMCSSKKGISAHQLYRLLDLGSYRTAWFMCHRVREAMRSKGLLAPLSGEIEADETYLHPRRRRGSPRKHEIEKDEVEMGLRPRPRRKGPYEGKAVIFGLQERGGETRTIHVPDATARTLQPLIRNRIDSENTRLITDNHPAYRVLNRYMRHDTLDHSLDYVKGDIHTQNIENAWSVLKRGIYGVFHHVSEDYLPSYLAEFDFRRNRRKITDVERFVELMRQIQGRLTWYCKTPQPENPHA